MPFVPVVSNVRDFFYLDTFVMFFVMDCKCGINVFSQFLSWYSRKKVFFFFFPQFYSNFHIFVTRNNFGSFYIVLFLIC